MRDAHAVCTQLLDGGRVPSAAAHAGEGRAANAMCHRAVARTRHARRQQRRQRLARRVRGGLRVVGGARDAAAAQRAAVGTARWPVVRPPSTGSLASKLGSGFQFLL